MPACRPPTQRPSTGCETATARVRARSFRGIFQPAPSFGTSPATNGRARRECSDPGEPCGRRHASLAAHRRCAASAQGLRRRLTAAPPTQRPIDGPCMKRAYPLYAYTHCHLRTAMAGANGRIQARRRRVARSRSLPHDPALRRRPDEQGGGSRTRRARAHGRQVAPALPEGAHRGVVG